MTQDRDTDKVWGACSRTLYNRAPRKRTTKTQRFGSREYHMVACQVFQSLSYLHVLPKPAWEALTGLGAAPEERSTTECSVGPSCGAQHTKWWRYCTW